MWEEGPKLAVNNYESGTKGVWESESEGGSVSTCHIGLWGWIGGGLREWEWLEAWGNGSCEGLRDLRVSQWELEGRTYDELVR